VFWALENAAIRIFLPWIWLCAAWALFPWAQEAQAQVPPGAAGQTPAPITVTPRSLSPAQRSDGTAVDLPASGGLIAPPGADRVSVMIGSVVVDGGFPGMDAARQAAFTSLVGRKTTLDALYDAASALETAYTRAGYVLVRVAVPPQDLVPGGPFRVVVVDGFIEAADLSALPRAVRGPVAASLAPVLRRHRLRMADIEQALLLAGDTPGLALRSALARGTEPGGTRLVIDGTFDRQSATLGARNDYAPQLGTYGFSAEATLNSPLGMGEAFYGYLAGGKDLARLVEGHGRVLVVGGGALVRVAHGRLTFNPEITLSRTRPDPLPGTPPTLGVLKRGTLRANYALLRRRQRNSVLSLAVEATDVANRAPDFALELSRDRYLALRVGLNITGAPSRPASLSFTISQGLGQLGMLLADTPRSRQGTQADFTRIELGASLTLPALANTLLTLSAKGQSSLGQPLYRTEQFSLEGEGAVSAYVGGLTAVDEGAWLRGEIGLPRAQGRLFVAPYLFGIAGTGRTVRPTLAEPGNLKVAAIGAGLRARLGTTLSLAAELATTTSDYAPLNGVRRLSVSLGAML